MRNFFVFHHRRNNAKILFFCGLMAHVTFWTAKHESNNQLNKTLIRAVPQCIIDNIYDNTKQLTYEWYFYLSNP